MEATSTSEYAAELFILEQLETTHLHKLSGWEKDFLLGVKSFFNHGTVSDEQIKKLRQIWARKGLEMRVLVGGRLR